MQSFAIVRGDLNDDGTWKWTSVVGDTKRDNAKYTFGIDAKRTRSGAANLMVFNDYLYIGEYNDEEIAVERILFDNDFEFMNANFKQSVNFYRMDKEENIQLIVGDADEMFPNGGLSGQSSGFGKNENQYIWKMQVYDGKLYVGTYDASSFLLPLDEYAEYLRKADYGFDLYVTEDGINFETITTDGFGDKYNHGCRAFGVTNDGLCVGTANPFCGAQVWKLSYTETKSDIENGNTESKSNTDNSNTNNGTDVVNSNEKAAETGDIGTYYVCFIILISAVVVLAACTFVTKRKDKE